jgi:hypothetical protein
MGRPWPWPGPCHRNWRPWRPVSSGQRRPGRACGTGDESQSQDHAQHEGEGVNPFGVTTVAPLLCRRCGIGLVARGGGGGGWAHSHKPTPPKRELFLEWGSSVPQSKVNNDDLRSKDMLNIMDVTGRVGTVWSVPTAISPTDGTADLQLGSTF